MSKRMKKMAWLLSVAMLAGSVDKGVLVNAQDMTEIQEESDAVSESEEEVWSTESLIGEQEGSTEAEEDEIIEIAADEAGEEETELLIEVENAEDFNIEDGEKEQISAYNEEDYIAPDWKIEYERSVEVGIGQKKELKVNITGTTEKLKYQWYDEDTGKEISGATSSSYTVSSNIADKKDYMCKITDSTGWYRQAYITVTYGKNYGTLDVTAVGDQDVYATVGKTLELSVYATTTTDNKISYVWKKEVNDKWVTLTSATTDTYKKKMEVSDRGEYLCVVSDGTSEKKIGFEVHVLADVQYKEEVIVEVPYGERVTLKQDATTKDGTLQYIWRDWEGDGEGENKPTHVTQPITENTTYYCEFWVEKNGEEIGESFETTYKIRVKTDWNISAPEEVAADSNGRATLTVQVSGANKDQLTYKWEKFSDWSGDALGTSQTYTTEKIDGIEIYRCTVSDRYQNSKSITIIAGKKQLLDTLTRDYVTAVMIPTTGSIEFAIVDMTSTSAEYTGAYLKFIPDKTGYWNFAIKDDGNPWTVQVLSSDKKVISYLTGTEDNRVEQYLKAGNTYYVHLYSTYGSEYGVKSLSAAYTGKKGFEQHVWKTVYVNKKATCTESGERIVGCSKCLLRKVEEIPASGAHSFGSWIISKKATCTANGTKYRTCSKCGKKEETQIAKTGHKFGSYGVTKKPTMTAQGTKTRTCINCGKKENIAIPKITQSIPLQAGKSLMLSRVVTSGKIASAASMNTKVATLTSKEKVTGKAAGTSVIEVKLTNGNSVYVQIAVQKKAVATTKITGVPTSVKLNMGQSKKLVPALNPITSGDKVTYTSSNKKVATVSSSGVITAKKSGTAKITVKSGSKKVTVTVTVAKKAPTGISGVPATKELKKGKSFAIKAKLTPAGAEGKITYQSSNKSVATVDNKGKVKAKKAGTAVITVKVGNIKRTCKVMVK